ncbi:uncharacterized protein LOC121399294 isoform X1 [Xenopus laevis]|uniref:ribonuclease H n=1 Tax=Xenopus laevis TaxID=8355 RepID=A0A8J1M1A5_XENLA|nr:uncharacterized protein LOC121399294 isoform X1 [Xenopus laevis]
MGGLAAAQTNPFREAPADTVRVQPGHTKKEFAGCLMKASVSGAQHVGLSTNVLGVPGITHSVGVSKSQKGPYPEQGMGLEKGETPVILEAMVPWLNRYPKRDKAQLLREGFQFGFRIPGREGSEKGVSHKNLRSALADPALVMEKLHKEVGLGRMAGPFPDPPLPGLRVSPLGLVPKKEQGKFRLIHHLSHPKGNSVNDEIDRELVRVCYTSFDEAVRLVREAGRGALMAKADVESAFRLLPVHRESLHLLGCFFGGGYYVDRSLPMGCSISCSYFEAFSTFLEWVVRQKAGVNGIIHYLDDFLCVGPSDSALCGVLLQTLCEVASEFGVPLANDKTEGPTTCLKFLGIEIDTIQQECRIPQDKIWLLEEEVRYACAAKKVTLRQLQSLLGKLNFTCRIIPMGRVFSRGLSMATAGVQQPHHFIRLNKEHKADLEVWQMFLRDYNGRAYWLSKPETNTELDLFTDAAGSLGFGAYFKGAWCAAPWPESWASAGLTANLTLLELFPIVVAVEAWGQQLANNSVIFHSDNMSTVMALNNLTSGSRPVLGLLRHLVLRCLQLNIEFRAKHVPGCVNNIADALSRFQWDKFRKLAPGADIQGTPCPELVWRIV